MKNTILVAIWSLCGLSIYAQCNIPNGDFDDFTEHTGGELGSSIVMYWAPDGGWNESIPNLFSRAISGEGFFYRYTADDANGNALELVRGSGGGVPVNSGFNRFECSDVPSKVKGRYKFSGSDLPGVIDTLRIAAYFKRVSDTLPLVDEYQANLPDDAVILDITNATSAFSDFELDMSSFDGEDVDYLTIQFIIKSGFVSLGYLGTSTAVIDDLELDYSALTIDEFSNDNSVIIFPNPAKERINIQCRKEDILQINMYDIYGKKYDLKHHNLSIDISNMSTGVYVLSIQTKAGKTHVCKVIKE